MKGWFKNTLKFVSLMLLPLILVSCSTGPKLVKLEPAQFRPTFNIVQGKYKGILKIKAAFLKPGGELKTFKPVTVQEQNPIALQLLISQPNNSSLKNISFPQDFVNSLYKSLEAITLDKGYDVVGAFDSWDVMTYGDKKNIDFLIIPTLKLYDEGKYPVCKEAGNGGPLKLMGIPIAKGTISCTGYSKLEGQLILEIMEPMTREKLYIKSFDFASKPQNINVVVNYEKEENRLSAYTLAYSEVNEAEQNALNRTLQDIYNKYIEIFKKYLPTGQEAKELLQEAKKLKTIKRY